MYSLLKSLSPKLCLKLIANKESAVLLSSQAPLIRTPFKIYIYATKEGKQFYHGGIGEKEVLFRNSDTNEVKFGYGFELMCCRNSFSADNFLSSKVIGEATCYMVNLLHIVSPSSQSPDELTQYQPTLQELSGFDADGIAATLHNKDGFALYLTNFILYDKPRALGSFSYVSLRKSGTPVRPAVPIRRPPGNFLYIEE